MNNTNMLLGADVDGICRLGNYWEYNNVITFKDSRVEKIEMEETGAELDY